MEFKRSMVTKIGNEGFSLFAFRYTLHQICNDPS
jgi:hypothetical protein